MKRIYIEGLYGRLIPVKVLGKDPDSRNSFKVRVLEDIYGYAKGEELEIHRIWLVHSAGYRNHFRMVTPADLSQFDEDPTCPPTDEDTSAPT